MSIDDEALRELLAKCESQDKDAWSVTGEEALLLRRVGAFHFKFDVYDGEEDWTDWNGALVGRGPKYREEMGPGRDPTLPYSDFARLLDLGPYARALVAEHPSTPDDVEIELAKDPEAKVRRAVARRQPASLPALSPLSEDREVVGAIASNPTASPAILLSAMNVGTFGNALLKNPASDAAVLRRVFEEHMPKEIESQRATMIWPLIQHPKTPDDVLHALLANGLHVKAKIALLKRTNLSPALRAALEKDDEVRRESSSKR